MSTFKTHFFLSETEEENGRNGKVAAIVDFDRSS